MFAKTAVRFRQLKTDDPGTGAHTPVVERVDKMVQLATRSLRKRNPDLDAISEKVDALIGGEFR